MLTLAFLHSTAYGKAEFCDLVRSYGGTVTCETDLSDLTTEERRGAWADFEASIPCVDIYSAMEIYAKLNSYFLVDVFCLKDQEGQVLMTEEALNLVK